MREREAADSSRLRGGMQVFGPAGQSMGAIERFDDAELVVQGERFPLTLIDRIEGDRVYLTASAAPVGAGESGAAAVAGSTTGAPRPAPAGTTAPAAGEASERAGDRADEIRVPVVEERVEVETRPVELGAVEVRKTVEAEQQSVPVELAREEVHVERRDVAARPATEADLSGAFQEGTVRVPVRGEEAVARKAAVVTGEVVVDKTRTTETQEIAETVRRERVEVDEDAVRAAAPAAGARAAETRTAAGARGTGALGFGAAGLRDAGAGAEVLGADGAAVGRVKEVRDADFLIDRRGQRDVYVPFAAVAEATAGGLRLTVPAAAVDEQGWPNPPLL